MIKISPFLSKLAVKTTRGEWFKSTVVLNFQIRTCSSASEGSSSDCKSKYDGGRPSVLQSTNAFLKPSHKSKQSYLDMVTIFEQRDVHRRNHVEFIYAALKCMVDYGVERDIDVYKALINIMPKGKFIPSNLFQAEFMHYPKQQQCIIDLLEQMEDLGVVPDHEMEAMLLNVFGRRGHPLRKYWRMMYWMPKFKNLSPWPIPNPVPDDTLQIAKLAIERMCSIDLCSHVVVYDTKIVSSSLDKTWIVSGLSLEQRELLQCHPFDKTLFIEGPFLIWLRNRSINYFTLRSDPDVEFLKSLKTTASDDVSRLEVPVFGKIISNSIDKRRSIHQQEDGTIFAICATGTSTKDSLLSWVRLLEEENPTLGKIPIVFRLKSCVEEKTALIT